MIRLVNWSTINRRISRTFVMFAIFCGVLTVLSVVDLLGTAIVFLVLAAIAYWFAKLSNGV